VQGAGELLRLAGDGFVGIGVTNPVHPLEMASGAHCTAGGTWTNENISSLSYVEAIEAFLRLSPVKYNYIAERDEEYLGFIAEDVPDLVATNTRKGIAPMDMVALLVKVVQEQQLIIDQQRNDLNSISSRLAKLEELLKE
jgi:hypothetical protein